ncbi:helix-turn-helix domain-containing protein [Chryseobacterium indologenes]|uniref:helix-turn-helix domain-containing protein n=1 Tax=Chryseobacterium TaxID=59732 RepID=UPI001625970F|nr:MULTISPECIES: helix-turn-helix domain-containing protein [Chryseobacterium]MDM1554918.1 helix-turn-helix domain-containing protein [Chryseobacterium indologenes]WET50245.1 helix-turn-helix domain-containing protein [Chryseobacterium indologenes]
MKTLFNRLLEKKKNRPNFKRIYIDMIRLKYPDKTKELLKILDKEILTDYDLLQLNKSLFGNQQYNQKLKAYDRETILRILDFQKNNNLNNTQLASHFKLSRNTVTKWKKIFI